MVRYQMCLANGYINISYMREWLSWWSTTLPRSGPRVRVPSRALVSDIQIYKFSYVREWLSWWSTTLPRSGPRVRVPSRALFHQKGHHSDVFFLINRVLPDSNFRVSSLPLRSAHITICDTFKGILNILLVHMISSTKKRGTCFYSISKFCIFRKFFRLHVL